MPTLIINIDPSSSRNIQFISCICEELGVWFLQWWTVFHDCGSCVHLNGYFVLIYEYCVLWRSNDLFPSLSWGGLTVSPFLQHYGFNLSVFFTRNIVCPFGWLFFRLYLLILSDTYVCHTPSLYLTVPVPFQLVTATTLFWLFTATATHQMPYFQTIMAFCPFVNTLVRRTVFSTTIAFATCSCRSPFLLIIFHPPVRVNTSCFPPIDWLSPLKYAIYLGVASIPWAISKALLNVKSLSDNNLLSVFSSFIHTQLYLVSLSLLSYQSCNLPTNVWDS